jgi:hypothetical protein
VKLLAKTDLTQAAVTKQTTQLSNAIAALEKAPCDGGDNCTSGTYTDLDTTLWYHPYVDYVVENQLMVGYGNQFSPYVKLSRGMLMQILYNQAGRPAVTAKSPFSDVPSGQWYSDAVIWAYEQGIAKGYGNGIFGPSDPITRDQLATFLWRAAGEPNTTKTTLAFPDASDVSSFAQKAMLWANENQIIIGYDDGTLKPLETATRVEAATMVARYFQQ